MALSFQINKIDLKHAYGFFFFNNNLSIRIFQISSQHTHHITYLNPIRFSSSKITNFNLKHQNFSYIIVLFLLQSLQTTRMHAHTKFFGQMGVFSPFKNHNFHPKLSTYFLHSLIQFTSNTTIPSKLPINPISGQPRSFTIKKKKTKYT